LPRSGAGARSAANPHAACDAAGTGNGTTAPPTRARRGKPWIQTRSGLRVTAPVPDPTDVIVEIAGQSITNIYDYTTALDLLKIGQPVKVIYTGAGKRVETR